MQKITNKHPFGRAILHFPYELADAPCLREKLRLEKRKNKFVVIRLSKDNQSVGGDKVSLSNPALD
jgi:hypothetical protein